MYTCPHCGNLSISVRTAALFKPPFDGRAVCPICKAHLRMRWTVSRFLLPIYLFARSALGLLFNVHADLGFIGEMTVVVILVALQLRFISYREACSGHEPPVEPIR
jgi:hypothetical protein